MLRYSRPMSSRPSCQATPVARSTGSTLRSQSRVTACLVCDAACPDKATRAVHVSRYQVAMQAWVRR